MTTDADRSPRRDVSVALVTLGCAAAFAACATLLGMAMRTSRLRREAGEVTV